MIVMDDRRERLQKLFESVEFAGTVDHPLSMPYEHFDVFVCRKQIRDAGKDLAAAQELELRLES